MLRRNTFSILDSRDIKSGLLLIKVPTQNIEMEAAWSVFSIMQNNRTTGVATHYQRSFPLLVKRYRSLIFSVGKMDYSDVELTSLDELTSVYIEGMYISSGIQRSFSEAVELSNRIEEDIFPAMGRFIRNPILRMCKRRGYTYVGLGDEIESFDSSFKVGVRSIHVNNISPRPFKYVLKNYNGVITARDHFYQVHGDVVDGGEQYDGQRKLLVMIQYFIQLYQFKTIVYVGAAPGDSLESVVKSYSWIDFILVDPRPMSWDVSKYTNVTYFQEKLSSWRFHEIGDFGLFMDIRSDKGVQPEDEIQLDNELMFKLHMEAADTVGFKYSSIKFRPPKGSVEIIAPRGMMVIQPWTRLGSYETRIISSAEGGDLMSINVASYHSQMNNWNFWRVKNRYADREQERSLIQASTIVMDAFDWRSEDGQFASGIWSLSNLSNSKNFRSKITGLFENNDEVLTLFPNAKIARYWNPGDFGTWYWKDICRFTFIISGVRKQCVWALQDEYVEVVIKTEGTYVHLFDRIFSKRTSSLAEKVVFWPESSEPCSVVVNGTEIENEFIVTRNDKGEEFLDLCINEFQMCQDTGCTMLLLSDLWMHLNYDIFGKLYMNPESFDLTHPVVMLWQCFAKGSWLFDKEIQSWINSQTHWVKTISVTIREVWNIEDVHKFRRRALKKRYPKSTIILDERITGIIPSRGKVPRVVAVSGHFLNLLLLTHLGVIDIHRHMMMIEGNLKMVSRNTKVLERWQELAGEHLIVENRRPPNKLWHSYYDYEVAVETYQLICFFVGFQVDIPLVNYVQQRLTELRSKYNIFNRNGFQADEYLHK
jgi:hypothetical protein